MIEKPNEFVIGLIVAMAFVYSRMSHLPLSAAFNGGLLRMDAWRFWIDAQKRLRMFEGFPGSDAVGNIVQTNENGATAGRPASPVTGQQFYDTTLNKPIWWSGANWRDAAGAIV